MTDQDDLTIEIQLRPIAEVAGRMAILASLIQVALLLADPDDDRPTATIEQELDDLTDALLIGELADLLSDKERQFLQSERDRLDEETIVEMLWRAEALEALSWSTDPSAGQLSEPWRQADMTNFVSSIPPPWDELDAFADARRLRPENEIAARREAAELWTWRSAVEEELRSAKGRAQDELLATVRDVADEAAQAELLDANEGDFLVDRKPYHRVDDETKALIAEVSFQRLWALNWLCGFGETWDEVPLDV
jgi:hypothetical protein